MKEETTGATPDSLGPLFNQYLDTVWELAQIQNKTEKTENDEKRTKSLEYGLYICSKRLISLLGLPTYIAMLGIVADELSKWNAEKEPPPEENKIEEPMIKERNNYEGHRFPYRWTLADARFTKDKGKVFSCFACGGGSTMGYKLAGFDVLGCNEIDPKMIEAYRANHDPKYSFLEPIQTFKERDDIPEELYNLDILDGSPPCSSFSMAGNREKDWGKEKVFREGQAEQVLDTLFFDFIDLAAKLKPKVVVAENVKGLMMGEAKAYVRKIYEEFDRAGYYVQHWLFDASTMGVPQRRERVFFICLRKDLAEPFLYAKDLFTTVPKLELGWNERPITFGEFRSEEGIDASHTEMGKLMPLRTKEDKSIGDINMRLYQKLSGFTVMIRHDEDVMGTITAGNGGDFRFHDGLKCSDQDYMLGGTYPTDYEFKGNKPQYLIGMSVPPVMTAQIATQIHEQWLSKLKP
jgi:DNA (cytosine-5)-methyltransferase 1